VGEWAAELAAGRDERRALALRAGLPVSAADRYASDPVGPAYLTADELVEMAGEVTP
jgi:hypothetical protein